MAEDLYHVEGSAWVSEASFSALVTFAELLLSDLNQLLMVSDKSKWTRNTLVDVSLQMYRECFTSRSSAYLDSYGDGFTYHDSPCFDQQDLGRVRVRVVGDLSSLTRRRTASAGCYPCSPARRPSNHHLPCCNNRDNTYTDRWTRAFQQQMTGSRQVYLAT